jgi:hypothetical protein
LVLAVLIVVLAGGSIAWVVSAHRHGASTYGIADPSSAALRIENRTTDFAITRVSFEGTAQGEAVRDVYGEIAVDAEAVLEIAPGTYLVKVFYVEIKQAVAGRPKGFLSESFSVSPGKAAVLSFQGGRSSPEGMVFIPPKLALK